MAESESVQFQDLVENLPKPNKVKSGRHRALRPQRGQTPFVRTAMTLGVLASLADVKPTVSLEIKKDPPTDSKPAESASPFSPVVPEIEDPVNEIPPSLRGTSQFDVKDVVPKEH